jgi:ATP-dependent DNA helicase RecG
LASENVLNDAIQTGVNSTEYFAIASGHDGARYVDLKYNQFIGMVERSGYLVKIDVAKQQLAEEDAKRRAEVYVYNDGIMPVGLNTTEKLFEKHSSKPFNPKLAQIFFKSGMIERWGRGFDKIREACEKYANTPLPDYDISETGVMVLCKPCESYMRLLKNGGSVTYNDRTWSNMAEVLSESEKNSMRAILEYIAINDSIDNAKARELTRKSATTIKRYLKRLCEIGVLKKTGSTSNTIYMKTEECGRT